MKATSRHVPLLIWASTLGLSAQTLGQFRLVDFSPRTAAAVSAVSGGTAITTDAPHGYRTGTPVYIYQPLTLAQDANVPRTLGNSGNRGRGYFLIRVIDEKRFDLTEEMYSGSAVNLAGYGVAAGDRVVPLTTYYLRQGPRGWLDGPIRKGEWSPDVAYRAGDMVTLGEASYLAVAGHTGRKPPDADHWSPLDPARIGPGVFTASLRDPNGRGGSGNPAFARLKNLLDTYWPQPKNAFDWDVVRGYGGTFASMSAFRWFVEGDPVWRAAALRLAERAEDFANGSVACNPAQGYCGRGAIMDYARIGGWIWTGGLSAIYDSLSRAQKTALADRLLNHNDVLHNGIEASGEGCQSMQHIAGPGAIRGAGYIITGSGFSELKDLQPGSALFWRNGSALEALGRVKSVDSDTQITMEGAYVSRVSGAAAQNYASWWYSPPFGYGGEKTCGVAWWWTHHASSPRTIPGQELTWNKDFPPSPSPDDSPQNNRTLTGVEPLVAIAMLLGHDDIRAVRLGEQAINYYMTQAMAQSTKSRWTGLNGHGTQYGPGRMDTTVTLIAWILKNSLTVTPPGILDGGYIANILRGYQYDFWLGQPVYVQPWANGSFININGEPAPAGEQLHVIGPPMMIAANLYPGDPFAAHTWDYLRERRGDFNILNVTGGWGSLFFIQYAFPFYDPSAPAASVKSLPLQQGLWQTDVRECIDAGLYCRPETGLGLAFSQTGWEANDTQVMIQAQTALPVWNEDNYGTAGNITILQNNGPANSEYLLGGNGGGLSGIGSGQSPSSGLYDGNTISIYSPATGDQWGSPTIRNQYAGMERWAGHPVNGPADNSYAYAMVNLTPMVRDSARAYTSSAATRASFYAPGANATRVQRHFLHFKNGSGKSNYVVVYDDVNVANANQLRAYWHYQVTDLARAPKRHTDWITTMDRVNRRVVMTTVKNRLSSRFLAVPGAGGIALATEDFSQTWCDHPTAHNPSGVCDGNYRRPANPLPGAVQPGTYRVHVCSSADGVQCAPATSAEWIAIHKPAASTDDVMPEIAQPACAGAAGDCAVVEILDPGQPKVAVFARQAAPLTGASFTTGHTGSAQYVVAGLAPGMYRVMLGGATLVRAATVAAGDGTLSFVSGSGAISIQGAPAPRPPVRQAGLLVNTAPVAEASRAVPEGSCSAHTLVPPAVDRDGNLYVADTARHAIRRISNGEVTTVAGNGFPGYSGDGGPATEARLNAPAAVAVDAAGNLYIADTQNHLIRRVANGVITTVAGAGRPGFSGDGGPAAEAALNLPGGIAADLAGNLYIADSGNHRVRRVSGGAIETVAGSGAVGPDGDGGPASDASLLLPAGVWLDAEGALHIADNRGERIRRVAGGVISALPRPCRAQ
jgi:Heparinase II C-terminal domain/NHL repeat